MSTDQLPDIRAEADVTAAARFMVLWDTDKVEVFSGGKPIGIVTERDIIRHVAKQRPCSTCIAEVLEDPSTEVGNADRERGRSFQTLTAGDVMSSPAIACSEHATLHEIAELLSDREISGVPVVDDSHRVLGVVSERDVAQALGAPLLRLAMKHPLAQGPFLRAPHRSLCAADVMSRAPLVAGVGTDLRTLADVMITAGVNRIPVVDDDVIVGVVTRSDVLEAVTGAKRREPAAHQAPIVIGP